MPQLAHIVFFKLKNSQPQAAAELVAACKEHLTGHEGTVYFSAGTLNAELNRPVNDRGFDVALHVVFADKAAHDRYQVHPRHNKFVELHRDTWQQVRVFDSDVTP